GPVLDLDRELDRGRVGRRIERAAVADIELRAVEDAFDGRLLAVETTGREFEILVAAAVLEGVIVAVVVDGDDRGGAGPDDGLLARQQFGSGADADPGLTHAATPFPGPRSAGRPASAGRSADPPRGRAS